MIRSGAGLTAADYGTLPEDVRRRVEIVDGGVMVPPAPSRVRRRVARRLATAIEAAAPATISVEANAHLQLRDTPLLVRRPDVVMFDAALPDDAVLRPSHCVLVVEMAPVATAGKTGEYAASGIGHFWRVEIDDSTISVFRYQLDPTTRTYGLAGLDKGKLVITDPVRLELDLETLR